MTKEQVKNEAKDILDTLKNTDTMYWIRKKGSKDFMVNKGTSNRQNIYSYRNGNEAMYGLEPHQRFYGVYGDIVDEISVWHWGQIDSRTASDEEILSAIELVLTKGVLVPGALPDND